MITQNEIWRFAIRRNGIWQFGIRRNETEPSSLGQKRRFTIWRPSTNLILEFESSEFWPQDFHYCPNLFKISPKCNVVFLKIFTYSGIQDILPSWIFKFRNLQVSHIVVVSLVCPYIEMIVTEQFQL